MKRNGEVEDCDALESDVEAMQCQKKMKGISGCGRSRRLMTKWNDHSGMEKCLGDPTKLPPPPQQSGHNS